MSDEVDHRAVLLTAGFNDAQQRFHESITPLALRAEALLPPNHGVPQAPFARVVAAGWTGDEYASNVINGGVEAHIVAANYVRENPREAGHLVLDLAGAIPLWGAIADAANAAWYIAEGEYEYAAISGVAAIPGFGYFAAGGQAGKYGLKATRLYRAADIGANISISGYQGVQGYRNGNYVQVAVGGLGLGINGIAIARGWGRVAQRATVAPKGTPRGFANGDQFSAAGRELTDALRQSGLKVRQSGVRGSSVTGVSSKGGGFRVGPQNGMKASDVDVFIEFADDIGINASKNIPGFIHPNKLMKNYPALKAWSEKWSKALGREITPGGFKPGTFNDPDIIGF